MSFPPTIFEDWKRHLGKPDIKPPATDTYDSGPLMLEAAAQGLGVAIMLASHYNHSHDQRLRRVLEGDVDSSYRYFFVCRPRALQNRAVKIFRDWLVTHHI